MANENIPFEGVANVEVSIMTIMADKQFDMCWRELGWYVNPRSSSKGFEYYNASGNCKLIMEQTGTYITASFRNMASNAQNGDILVQSMLSSFADAKKFLIGGLEHYMHFNPQATMNQFSA